MADRNCDISGSTNDQGDKASYDANLTLEERGDLVTSRDRRRVNTRGSQGGR